MTSPAGADSARQPENVNGRRARQRGCGSARRLLLLALFASFLLGCSAASTGPAAVANSPAESLGVYHGPVDRGGVENFQKRVGHKVSHVHDYLDRRTWKTITDISWLTRAWASAGYNKRMVLTVPMLPNKSGTLASGATGRYNKYFRALALHLVKAGFGDAILRLGHEFNGDWFRWSIKVRNGAQNYIKYWRQIVTTMNSVPGAHFKYDWCPNAGSAYITSKTQLSAAKAWPGDAYVDYVGMDVFDQSYIPNYRDPAARWNDFVNQHDGMAWQASFAAAHGKPLSYPEWGLVDRMDGHGGGDNPSFIRQMHDWIQSHNVAYHLYFENYDPNADYGVFSGWFPNAANTFIDLFGSRGVVGQSIGGYSQAQLRISRPMVKRRSRFNAATRFSPRASGEARVQIAAGGRKIRFSTMLRGGKGRLKLNRAVTRKMGRSGTGIITFAYGGDDDTHPQFVRLRAGPKSPRLRVQRPALADGRLAVQGQIDKRARGTVLVQLRYVVDAQIVTRSFSTRVGNGRWNLNSPLGDIIRAEIDRRQGPVTAAVLYTGYGPRRIRGELRSYAVLGPR